MAMQIHERHKHIVWVMNIKDMTSSLTLLHFVHKCMPNCTFLSRMGVSNRLQPQKMFLCSRDLAHAMHGVFDLDQAEVVKAWYTGQLIV